MEKVLNKAIICLGGNAPDSEKELEDTVRLLSMFGTIERCSGVYPTAPEYAGESKPYINEVLEFSTTATYSQTMNITQEYQWNQRTVSKYPYPEHVALDIDVVYWNGELLRPRDAKAAYFLEGMSKLDS